MVAWLRKSIHILLLPLLTMVGSYFFLEYNYRYFHRFMEQFVFFQDTTDYLLLRLGEPGGLQAYVAEYLTLFFGRPGGASFLLSLLWSVSLIGFLLYLKRVASTIASGWSLLPVALFWIYPQESMVPILSVVIAVWSAWLYLSLTVRPVRYAVGSLLLVGTYLLAAPAYLLFASLVVVAECCTSQGRTRWLVPLCVTALALLLPLIAMRTLYIVPVREAYWSKHIAHPEYPLPHALYYIGLLYPFVTILAYLLRTCRMGAGWKPGLRSGLAYAGVVVCMLVGVCCLKDPMEQAYRYDDWARQERWNRIVNHARVHGVKDVDALIYLNLALSHTGQFTSGLLHFPQVGESGFIPHDPKTRLGLILASEVAWQLGQTNAAQRFAFVGVLSAQRCVQPRLMKRLVETYLVNGEPRAAAKYLHLLEQNPAYRTWALQQRPLLEASVCDTTDWVVAKRKQLPLTDNPYDLTIAFPSAVAFLIDDHADNRPAWEYAMAYLLLYKDFGAFMHYMDLLNEQGVALPTLYQEAICFVCGVAQQTPAALDRYAIAPEVRNRFLQFLQQMKTQPAAALRQSFGDTYYYYAQYIPAPKQE